MRRFLPLLFLAACSGSAPAPLASPEVKPAPPVPCTRFDAVRVFDGEKTLPSASVVIEGTSIKEVNGSTKCGTTIAGAGKTLLPGLIDAHVHLWNTDQLEQAIRFGVTTELDMMSDPAEDVLIKKLVAASNDYADVRTAGNPVTTTHGHGTEYGFVIPTLDKPEDAEDFVAQRIAEKSDYLKIMYEVDSKIFKSITNDELKAVITSARRHHFQTVVHIDTQHEASDAVSAGADGLAHLFFDSAATPDFIAKMRSTGAFIVPTLSVLRTISGKPYGPTLLADPKLRAQLDPDAVTTLGAKYPITLEHAYDGVPASIKALKAAHIPILAGTDSPNAGTAPGVSLHGELELLVEAGLTPTEALVAATSAPSTAFQLEYRGRIAPGLHADLVLVDGDPTTDIKATRNIVGVWRNGAKFEKAFVAKPAHIPPPPETPKMAPAVIGNFDSPPLSPQWHTTVDAMAGGDSDAIVVLNRGALSVTGEVRGKVPFAWSGAIYNAGEQMFSPVDASAAKEIVFKAKGDGGKNYMVLVFTKKGGFTAARLPFVAPKTWKEQHFKLADFRTDGSDLQAIAFVASPAPGKYAFQLDDVELR